jgi:hypothetical protein
MDNWIQGPLTFQATGIVFRAERHASQPLTAAANTIVQYDAILEDPYAGWNATFFRWQAPYTGWYEVTITSTVSSATLVMSALVQTPESFIRLSEAGANGVLFGGAAGSQIVPLIGGSDWVKGATYVSAAATTNTVNGRYSTIEISFVSQ